LKTRSQKRDRPVQTCDVLVDSRKGKSRSGCFCFQLDFPINSTACPESFSIGTKMRTSLLLPLVSIQASAFANDVPLIRGRHAEAAITNRAVCNSDNVLRALKVNSASATPFCSTYIHISGSTIFKSVAGVTATTCGPFTRAS